MNKYDKMLKEWGRDLMREQGFDVPDDGYVSVDFEKVMSGYCDTCSWEDTYLIVEYGRASIRYEIHDLENLFKILIAYGEKKSRVEPESSESDEPNGSDGSEQEKDYGCC